MSRLFVVLSGLPGSGKTTLARPLSASLGLPLLDKDDVLESLFESLPVETLQERDRLSRASDAVLRDVARASQGAVLSSFWRQPSLSATSGTPTDWLGELADGVVVEVLCECPPRLAVERYAARERSAGHFDARTTRDERRWQFERLAAAGPIGVGPLLRVDTTTQVEVEQVAQAVRAAVGQPRAGAPPGPSTRRPCSSSDGLQWG